MSELLFVPTATEEKTRNRMDPAVYSATCIAVQPPALYKEFGRWFLRVDFAIHATGEMASKYLNLGNSNRAPKIKFDSRSEYYKLWSLAVGRKPEHGEPMDSARIVGNDFLLRVIDKEMNQNGEPYSVVEAVFWKLEPDTDVVALLLSSSFALMLSSSSSLSLSSSVAQKLRCSLAQLLFSSSTQGQAPTDSSAPLLFSSSTQGQKVEQEAEPPVGKAPAVTIPRPRRPMIPPPMTPEQKAKMVSC